ncbi:hypothetical protein KQI89_03045 [Clostridium sp. MSJ-4]|uniref:Membrane or secreted protein n=1 Tax=Clostridium simiarum TaxID=2841506 RepID=A0ABS6EWX3_9CLOT|nr:MULTISPECIES: hypothetical protein [Clostridium]MBU5590728.1 hypothetical protein [Clostridium simiarum]
MTKYIVMLVILAIGLIGYIAYSNSKKKNDTDYESIENNTPDGNCSVYCNEDFAKGEISCKACKVPQKNTKE